MNSTDPIDPTNPTNSSDATSLPDSPYRFRWLFSYAPLAILSAFLLILYSNTISRLFKGSFSYEKGHVFVLLLISFYLLWIQKKDMKTFSAQPEMKKGLAVTVLGALMLVLGRLSCSWFLEDISFPVAIMGIILLVGGLSYVRITWLSVSYMLVFMFGLIEYLLHAASIYLQYATAWIASAFLAITGMPVALSGVYLRLPHISLEVADGCSGVHHIVALMAIAVPIICIEYRSWLMRLPLLAVAFVIGIVANGMRVAAIGLWTVNHRDYVHGPHDIFYVSFIFIFGIALFLSIIYLVRRYGFAEGFRKRSVISDEKPQPSGSISVVLSSFLGIAIIVTTLFAFHRFEPRPVSLKCPMTNLPATIGEWSGYDLDPADSALRSTAADVLLYRTYKNASGIEAKVSIAYFNEQRGSKKIAYPSDWESDGMQSLTLTTNFGNVTIGKFARTSKESGHKNVYCWYDINGHLTASGYVAKTRIVREIVGKGINNGAIVVVAFNESSSKGQIRELSFLRQLIPVITAYLKQTI